MRTGGRGRFLGCVGGVVGFGCFLVGAGVGVGLGVGVGVGLGVGRRVGLDAVAWLDLGLDVVVPHRGEGVGVVGRPRPQAHGLFLSHG